jgi:hypothetical protein
MLWRCITQRRSVAIAIGATIGLANAAMTVAPASASEAATASMKHEAFVLDGVHLNISAAYLPGAFTAASPSSHLQQAASTLLRPFRSVTVVSAPFGTQPNETAVPIARSGGVTAYMESLAKYALASGAPSVVPSVTADLFGQVVRGEEAREQQPYDGLASVGADTIYWVVQAGGRLWVVSAIHEQKVADAPLTDFSGLSLSSPDPGAPSAMLRAESTPNQPLAVQIIKATGYALAPPTPWFTGASRGACAANSYWNTLAVALSSNSSWLGVTACGPMPATNSSNVPAENGANWSGWQCSELSSRFIFLAYHFYAAGNGYQVAQHAVTNSNGTMQYIANGTLGSMPQEGDVVSESDSGDGHTYVITGVLSPNYTSGTETVGLIEENGSSGGYRTMTVTNWHLGNASGVDPWDGETVTGWADPLRGGPGEGTSDFGCPLVNWTTGHFKYESQDATIKLLVYGYISEHDDTADCFAAQLVLSTGSASMVTAYAGLSAYYSSNNPPGPWTLWQSDTALAAPPARMEYSLGIPFLNVDGGGSAWPCLLANDVGTSVGTASVSNGQLPNIAVDVCISP